MFRKDNRNVQTLKGVNVLHYLQICQKQSNDDDSTSYNIRKKEYKVENKLEIVSTKLFEG